MEIDDRRERRRVGGAIGVVVAVGVMVLGIATIVGGGQTGSILSAVGAPIPPETGSAPAGGTPDAPVAESDTSLVAAVVDVARPDLLVIRTGTLDLQVSDVLPAVDAAAAAIRAVGGFVSGSDQAGDGASVTVRVTYRIPADAWDEALGQLRAMATRVAAETIRTEDVGAQVVDLRARIVNLRATEAALQAIMATATEVSDVLEVQGELSTVRGQIEEATARLRQIEDQVAMSTLTVTFGLKPLPAAVAAGRQFDAQVEVDRASAKLVRVIQRSAAAGIWIAIVWVPILLVGGIAIAVAVVVGRWIRRRIAPRRMASAP